MRTRLIVGVAVAVAVGCAGVGTGVFFLLTQRYDVTVQNEGPDCIEDVLIEMGERTVNMGRICASEIASTSFRSFGSAEMIVVFKANGANERQICGYMGAPWTKHWVAEVTVSSNKISAFRQGAGGDDLKPSSCGPH